MKPLTVTRTLFGAVVLLAACQERSNNPIAPELDRQARIVSASHGSGGSILQFLPPIEQRQPSIGTQLNAALLAHLSVEVCALANGACGALVHTFTAGGQHSERLRVVNDDVAHFEVNWHTGRYGLSGGTYYRITVKAAGQVLAHADAYVGNSAQSLRAVDRSQYVPVRIGSTLPIKFHVGDGVQVIGAAGGAISFLGGAATLVVGEGVLDESTAFTVEPLMDPPAGDGIFLVGGTVYDLGPDGFSFDEPVQLTIRYDEANLPAGVQEQSLGLMHFEDGNWHPVAGSTVNSGENTVSGPVTSFSPYGIGGTAAKLVFIVQPTDAIAGQTISPAVEVEIQDATGARVTTATNAVTLVAYAIDGLTTPLFGTTTVNAVNGVATFSGISMQKAGGMFYPYTLTASATGISSASSDEFRIYPAAAAKLVFADQPANGVTGLPIAGRQPFPAMQVQVQDAFGNETGANQTISIAIGSNPAGGTLFGTKTMSGGCCFLFTDLSIDKAGSGYTLVASSGTLPSVTSMPFNITSAFAAIGTPIVNGEIIPPTEWANASCTLSVRTPPTGETWFAQICFMTDANNLYFLANVIDEPAMPTRALTVEFDANGSGAIDSGDDVIYVATSTSPAFFDGLLFKGGCVGPMCCLNILCQASDADGGFSTNGAGAHGTANNIWSVLEMSHPRNSGEPVDISVAPGQKLGARITFTLEDASGNRIHSVIPAAGLVQLLIQ